jgi:hypothetical protein
VVLSFGLLASASHAATPRVLEVGDRGRIQAGLPAAVRIEITTAERLAGTLLVQLRDIRSPFGADTSGPEESLVCFSSRSRFVLEAGERRVVVTYLPDVPTLPWHGPEGVGFEVYWQVIDAAGREVGAGRQPVSIDSSFPGGRVLYLTDADVGSPRRAPTNAFDEALPYSEYTACVISGRDFSRLRHAQRAALLDRTALGSVLLITAPLAPLGPELDAVRAAPDAVVWRDDQGHEAREARLHLGFVRTVDRPLERLVAESGAEEAPLQLLLTAAWPLRPVSDESIVLLRDRLFGTELRGREGSGPDAGGAPVVLAVSLLAAAILLAVLVGAWWASRPGAAPSVRTLLAGSVTLAVAPALLYLGVAPFRVGNADGRRQLTYHDAASRLQSRWTQVSRGGGGGSDDPEIAFASGPRTLWSAERRLEDGGLNLSQDLEGRFRLGLGRRGLTSTRLFSLRRAELEADEPSCDDVAIELRDGRVVGGLRARRAFAQLAVAGPLGFAQFGSVRSGERIDLALVPWQTREDFWKVKVSGPELFVSVAHVLVLGFGYGKWRSGGSTYYVITAEAEEHPVVDAALPASVVVHVQSLSVEGAADARGGVLGVPADREADVLRVHVPELVWAQMRKRGLQLRPEVMFPEVMFLDESRAAEVSATVADGFRDVVFHLAGAPNPAPQRSLAGTRMVVARWQPASRP